MRRRCNTSSGGMLPRCSSTRHHTVEDNDVRRPAKLTFNVAERRGDRLVLRDIDGNRHKALLLHAFDVRLAGTYNDLVALFGEETSSCNPDAGTRADDKSDERRHG
jgi:hypothetical protein